MALPCPIIPKNAEPCTSAASVDGVCFLCLQRGWPFPSGLAPSHNASKDTDARLTTVPTAHFFFSFCFLKAVTLFITLYS